MSDMFRKLGTSGCNFHAALIGLLLGASGCMEPAAIGDSSLPLPAVSAVRPGDPGKSGVRSTTFTTAWFHSISYSPIALALGDMDGDHQLDIVAVNFYLTNIGLGLGSGHGELLDINPVWAHAPSTSVAVGLADLNRDGMLDVVVGSRDLGGSVLYGRAGGSLGAAVELPCVGTTSGLAIADLNGDGVQDIVMADSTSNAVCINFSNSAADGYNAVWIDVDGQNNSPVIADFNGDGRPDLAVGHIWEQSVSVLYGDGRGLFSTPQRLATDPEPRGLLGKDLNGDGRAELLVLHPGTSTIRLFWSLDKEQWKSAELTAHLSPVAAVAEDFDGDGNMDIAVANYASSDVSLLLGDGQGHFNPPVHSYSGVKPISLVAGDFDGDHHPDLVVGNLTTAAVRLLLNIERPKESDEQR
jgi:hypothetical protein